MELSAEVISEIRAHRKVNAIKLVREQHNLGLGEAKEIVDDYLAMHPYSSDQQPKELRDIGSKLLFAVIMAGLAYSLYRYFS